MAISAVLSCVAAVWLLSVVASLASRSPASNEYESTVLYALWYLGPAAAAAGLAAGAYGFRWLSSGEVWWRTPALVAVCIELLLVVAVIRAAFRR